MATQILGGMVTASARWPLTTAAWRSIAHVGCNTCPVTEEDADAALLAQYWQETMLRYAMVAVGADLARLGAATPDASRPYEAL